MESVAGTAGPEAQLKASRAQSSAEQKKVEAEGRAAVRIEIRFIFLLISL